MSGLYNNPLGRLNEARKHYKSLLNEQVSAEAKKEFEDDKELSGAAGYPYQCCDGQNCVPVTLQSSNDDCSDYTPPQQNNLTYTECDEFCGVQKELEAGGLDIHVNDVNDTNKPVTCHKCNNGFPVGQQLPQGTPCSTLGQGWQSSPIFNPPCEPTGSTTCDFPTMSTGCASGADLVNQFVSGDPSQFLANMATWYANPPGSGTGCDFLEVVKQKHLDHLSTGIAINGNHPNGIQMGPLWVAQKTSKVSFLNCILADLNSQGCCSGGSTGPGPGGPQANQGGPRGGGPKGGGPRGNNGGPRGGGPRGGGPRGGGPRGGNPRGN